MGGRHGTLEKGSNSNDDFHCISERSVQKARERLTEFQ